MGRNDGMAAADISDRLSGGDDGESFVVEMVAGEIKERWWMMEKLWIWLAWKCPRNLVRWCSYRMAADATTGMYGTTIVPELLMMEMFRRWDELQG